MTNRIDYSRLSDDEWEAYLADLEDQGRPSEMLSAVMLAAVFALIGGAWGWILATLMGCAQ